jgi:hypothetical protein
MHQQLLRVRERRAIDVLEDLLYEFLVAQQNRRDRGV